MNYLKVLKQGEQISDCEKSEKSEKRVATPATQTGQPPPAAAKLPQSVLTARYPLAALCRATLDANPAAGKLDEAQRRWIAEHLEAAILGWLVQVFKPEYAWEATCPKGHHVTDGVFVRTLMGWCCEHCKKVYAAGECRLRLDLSACHAQAGR